MFWVFFTFFCLNVALSLCLAFWLNTMCVLLKLCTFCFACICIVNCFPSLFICWFCSPLVFFSPLLFFSSDRSFLYGCPLFQVVVTKQLECGGNIATTFLKKKGSAETTSHSCGFIQRGNNNNDNTRQKTEEKKGSS